MKLLAIDLNFPESSQYINPDAAGAFLLGRLLTRWQLFAVATDKTMTPIVLTSAEVTEIQAEVNRQLEVLELREEVAELRAKLKKTCDDNLECATMATALNTLGDMMEQLHRSV